MADFITEFKKKAQSKTLTRADMLARCIYKAINAKSEDKITVLHALVQKAFTAGSVRPDRKYPYQAVDLAAYDLAWDMRGRYVFDTKTSTQKKGPGKIIGIEISELLSEEDLDKFKEMCKIVDQYGYKHHYDKF